MHKLSHYLLLLLFVGLTLSSCGDDDDAPVVSTVSFEETSYTVMENDGSLTVTVQLQPAAGEALSIPFDVSGSAVEGVDFTAISDKTVSVAEGQSSATISIDLIDNNFVENEDRTLILTLNNPTGQRVTLGNPVSTAITIQDNDMAGAVTVSLAETTLVTNEYLEDTVSFDVVANATFPEDITLAYTLGGTAVAGTNYTAPAVQTVTIPAGETTGEIRIPVLDTESYDQVSTLSVTLETPGNSAIALGAVTSAELSIINPNANARLFAPNEDFARLYAYNTFEDVPVPATGRRNTDPTLGTLFDESFAFTYYDASRPNTIGFRSSLWSEQDFTRSTSAFNMHTLYASGPAEWPGTVDENVSSGSAGIYILQAIRLVPSGLSSTSGTAIVPEQTVTVYRRDETDDGVVNPTSFEVVISGEGTYDEEAGIIDLTVTFDETSINNGIRVRRYQMPAMRRE